MGLHTYGRIFIVNVFHNRFDKQLTTVKIAGWDENDKAFDWLNDDLHKKHEQFYIKCHETIQIVSNNALY